VKTHLFLTGFSGTGKSAVGPLVAQRLGLPFVDLDALIVERAGRPVPEIFRDEGEGRFRALERALLRELADGPPAVVSTGGGAIVDPENQALMAQRGLIVCLEASPETIVQRLRTAQEGNTLSERPLLASADPLERVRALKAARQPAYARADWTVHTDRLTPQEVALEIVRAWGRLAGGTPWARDDRVAAVVASGAGPYPVIVGWGILDGLGEALVRAGLRQAAWVITDEHVAPFYGQQVLASLERAGLECALLPLPAGEATKDLARVGEVYRWLAERRAERGHAIVALGGGVIGDLAGFVAATYLRGMPLVQVPTSLLAMVDAAIGGKVAVNLPEGKNLVGAFHPPRLVYEDVAILGTLPHRERTEGWAEVIKHALILDVSFLEFLEAHVEELVALEREATVQAIAWSAAIKSRIVSQDEEETLGLRTILNYGHTLGHALETVTGYGQLLHGEAVSIGMMAAARISERKGLLPARAVERQEALLRRFGLPVRCPRVPWEALWMAMARDKKAEARSLRWVLLEGLGHAVVRGGVEEGLVAAVVQELMEHDWGG
jgi:shikimate kinase/3-dehydroquinate synthase